MAADQMGSKLVSLHSCTPEERTLKIELTVAGTDQECDVLLVVSEVCDVRDVPREKEPDRPPSPSIPHRQAELRVVSHAHDVLGGPLVAGPDPVHRRLVREHTGVPV